MWVHLKGHTWRHSWLRHCATSRKVAGLIPDGVTNHWYNHFSRTLALGSTQTLTYAYQGISCGGKCGRCVDLTTLPIVFKSGSLNSLGSKGPVQTCTGIALPLYLARLKLEFQYGTNLMWFWPCIVFIIFGNKMPTRCNRGFYCRSYCLLNMFRASLCPSSGAQEYYTVVAAWILTVHRL